MRTWTSGETGLYLPACLDTGTVGEPHVEHDDVGGVEPGAPHRFGCRARFADHVDVLLGLQQADQASPHHLVVVHHQYPDHASTVHRGRSRHGASCRGGYPPPP